MPGKSRDVHRKTGSSGRGGLTLQLDGLAGGRAVVTLVEASRLIGGLYLLGGSHHHPAGRVGNRSPQESEKMDKWGEKETREEVLPRGKWEPAAQRLQLLEAGGSTEKTWELLTLSVGRTRNKQVI